MLMGAQCRCDPLGGIELRPRPLAIVDAERMALVILRARHGEHGRRIETARQQNDGARTGSQITCRAHRPTEPCEAVVENAPVVDPPESNPPASSATAGYSLGKKECGSVPSTDVSAKNPCSSH